MPTPGACDCCASHPLRDNVNLDLTVGKYAAWVLALGFGACMPLSLAPFDWWPLGIVSVGGWFWLLFKTPANGVVLGLAYGVGKFAVGVSWVYVSINVYGGVPPPLALFFVGMFVLTLSLFTMAQAWLYVWAKQSRPTALPPDRKSVV